MKNQKITKTKKEQKNELMEILRKRICAEISYYEGWKVDWVDESQIANYIESCLWRSGLEAHLYSVENNWTKYYYLISVHNAKGDRKTIETPILNLSELTGNWYNRAYEWLEKMLTTVDKLIGNVDTSRLPGYRNANLLNDPKYDYLIEELKKVKHYQTEMRFGREVWKFSEPQELMHTL